MDRQSAWGAWVKEVERDRPGVGVVRAELEAIDARCEQVRGRLAQCRRDAGLRQSDMADRLGITQSSYSKLETGTGDIGLKTLMRLADALQVPLGTLVAERDEPFQMAAQTIEGQY